MNWKARALYSSLAFPIALTAAMPAAAQTNEAPSPAPTAAANAGADAVPEIIVTAQFRSQRLQDTPIAITAMSAATLQARSQTNVVDIGAFSPNVNLSAASSSTGGNAVSAFIRGVGQSDASFALEPGVGIYLDDVYYGTTFGAVFDLTDLDRVEVLRGPQGTLSGKNSVGGAVKLYTRKPDASGGGFIEGTYGRFNRIDVRASADLAIADGFYARLSGVAKKTDGFLTDLDYGCANPGRGIAASPRAGSNCKIGTEGGTDVKALRLALRYAPTGSPLEINLVGDVADDRSEVVATKLVYANNPLVRSYDAASPAGGVPFDSRFLTGRRSYTSYATFQNGGNFTTVFGVPYQVVPGTFIAPPQNTARSYGVSGVIDYKLSDAVSLKSITAYRRASGYNGLDIDGSPLDLVTQRFDLKHEQFTQELRLTGKVGTLIDYTVGGFYYDAHDRVGNRIEIPIVLFDFLSDDPVRNRSVSAFGHVEVHPLPALTLIGGLRYTDDKKTYTFSRRNPDGTLPSGIPLTTNFTVAGLDGATGTYKKDHVDYRLGVNYRWSDALMTYAQVSTGFKGGGVNPRPYVRDQVVPFGPEKLTTYEIGAKADLFGRVLRLNGALFYNDYTNIQLTLLRCPASVSVTCSQPANAGNAHVKGAELEATLRPMRALTINGSVGYLDFKYTSVNAATNVTLDMKAPFNNKWQGSGGIEYAADVGGGHLTPRLDWIYQSSFYYNAVNTPLNRIAGRSLFNARLTYESADRGWSISASATNLFNKFYYVAANENVANYGVSTNVVGRPREWAVTLRRRF